jgi:hypothetical protein
MLQASARPRFTRSATRGRPYTILQHLGFLVIVPLDVAFLLMIILVVGALIKLMF